MYYTSPRILRIMAAMVWLGGSVALTLKGSSLLAEADIHHPDHPLTWYAGILGIGIGSFKGIFIFYRIEKKNLYRIASLSNPRIWQFYRPKFFLFLLGMIILGILLSRMAAGNYTFLIFVAALDLSIATFLLTSSVVFLRYRKIISG